MKRLYWIPAFALLVLGLLAGCGSEVDDDWTPVNVEASKHEFGAISNHGSALVESDYAFSECTQCHGTTLAGLPLGDPGDPVRSCFTCHTKQNHQLVFSGEGGNGFEITSAHAQWMRDNGWMMDECAICHAPNNNTPASSAPGFGAGCADAAGCHDSELGAEACNTCHGNFGGTATNPLNWASSGAHATHLAADSDLYAGFSCEVCHNMPSTLDSPGHYNDDTPGEVEVLFDGVADAGSADPSWDGTTETCSNVYCHGDLSWDMQNVDFTCSSCHGFPPATGHPQVDNCGQCHDTVDANDNMLIVNPDQHMNGSVD